MRVGLCDFNRTELKAFLYKENSTFAQNLGVFFHRVIYLIPTGTWMNGNELISQLEIKEPEAVETVFEGADVNQSVRRRIDAVSRRIFLTNINDKIDQINRVATHPIIKKYSADTHDVLKAIHLAKRMTTPSLESELKLLNEINIDSIKPFLENLAYFDDVIRELKKIRIEISSETIKKNIGKTKAEITELQKHLIMDHYGDYKVIQSYIEPLFMLANLTEQEKKALSILSNGSNLAIENLLNNDFNPDLLPSLTTKLMPIVREELALLTGEFNEPFQSFVKAIKNETAFDESALFDFLKEQGSIEEAALFAKTPFNNEPFLILKAKRKQDFLKRLSQPVEFYEGMSSPLVDAIRETHAGKPLKSDFLKSLSAAQIQKELTELNLSISKNKSKEIIQRLINTDLLLNTTKGKDFDFLRILKVIMRNEGLSPQQDKWLKERIESSGSFEEAVKRFLTFNPDLKKDQIVD